MSQRAKISVKHVAKFLTAIKTSIFYYHELTMIFNSVGPLFIFTFHTIDSWFILRRRFFGPSIQEKSLASLGRSGIWSRTSMGRM